jgi:hypothetical protein
MIVSPLFGIEAPPVPSESAMFPEDSLSKPPELKDLVGLVGSICAELRAALVGVKNKASRDFLSQFVQGLEETNRQLLPAYERVQEEEARQAEAEKEREQAARRPAEEPTSATAAAPEDVLALGLAHRDEILRHYIPPKQRTGTAPDLSTSVWLEEDPAVWESQPKGAQSSVLPKAEPKLPEQPGPAAPRGDESVWKNDNSWAQESLTDRSDDRRRPGAASQAVSPTAEEPPAWDPWRSVREEDVDEPDEEPPTAAQAPAAPSSPGEASHRSAAKDKQKPIPPDPNTDIWNSGLSRLDE